MSDVVRLMVGPKQPDNVRFGELLWALRDAHSYSRAKAADMLDLSSEFLRLIETGKRTPVAGTTRHILEIYEEPFEVHREGSTYVVTFRDHSVQFMSRIQEARSKVDQEVLDGLVNRSRNERIGRIVSLLTVADDKMINDVYQKLKGS